MTEFDVQGAWVMLQGKTRVEVNLNAPAQDGFFIGHATHSGHVQGSGLGSLRFDQFFLRIRWSDGTEGAYHGVFNGRNELFGSTFDVQNPTSIAAWTSDRPFVRR